VIITVYPDRSCDISMCR